MPASAADEDVLKALAKALLQKQCALLRNKANGVHKGRIAKIELKEPFGAFNQRLDDATSVSDLQSIGNVLSEHGSPWAKGECSIALIVLRYLEGTEETQSTTLSSPPAGKTIS